MLRCFHGARVYNPIIPTSCICFGHVCAHVCANVCVNVCVNVHVPIFAGSHTVVSCTGGTPPCTIQQSY